MLVNGPQLKRAIGGLAGWQARALEDLAQTRLPKLTVASLAQAAHLSPYHFSRAFKVTFGMPPREWLLQRRLARAKERLLQSSATIEQIAVELGYRSGSQFSRVFRSRVGVSPQAFRRA